jgi:beta-glucanase (GH16 family)
LAAALLLTGQALAGEADAAEEAEAVAGSQIPVAGHELVWSDEFNGKELNLTKWGYRGLGKRRDGVNVKECVNLDGKGHVVLTTKKVGNDYHTAMIGTQHKFEFTYGYIEGRVKLPTQVGHWPTFWLLSPTCRVPKAEPGKDGVEVDIFEYLVKDGGAAATTIHSGEGAESRKASNYGPQMPRIPVGDTGWHTFGALWTKDKYEFFLDGRKTWETDKLISHRSEYVILSLEVWNSDWCGDPAKAKFPDHFYVDYVRVYQPKGTRNVSVPAANETKTEK